MKRVHDLLDRGGPIPPMYVQDVDVRRAKLLERCPYGDVQGFCIAPGVIHIMSDLILASLKVG